MGWRIHEFEYIGTLVLMSLNPYITRCIRVFTMNTAVFMMCRRDPLSLSVEFGPAIYSIEGAAYYNYCSLHGTRLSLL